MSGSDTGDGGVSVILELVPDPTNQHDKNAVAVRIDGAHAGYIGRDEASLVGAMLKKLGGGRSMRCRCTIRGGGEFPFEVVIDGIPDAYDHGA